MKKIEAGRMPCAPLDPPTDSALNREQFRFSEKEPILVLIWYQ